MNVYFDSPIGIEGIAAAYPSNMKDFKQFSMAHTLILKTNKPEFLQVLRVKCSVNILGTSIIRSPEGTSYEGEILTGYEVLIEGNCIYTVEYIGDDSENSLHSEQFTFHFANSIQLEACDSIESHIAVTPYIEHINIKVIDNRKLESSTLLLVTACSSSPSGLGLAHISSIGCTLNPSPPTLETKPFLQFNAEKIVIPAETPDDVIVHIFSSIIEGEIKALKVIETMKGLSSNGQILTGKAASVEIEYKYKILYVDCNSALHGIEGHFYENAYIAVPDKMEGSEPEILVKSSLLKPRLTLGNKLVKLYDSCKIYINVDSFLELSLCPTYQLCYSAAESPASSCLYLSYEDGSRSIAIVKDKNRKTIKPCWSPGGQFIAYLSGSTGKYQFNVINLQTGKLITPPTNNDFDFTSSFCWLKDGRNIVFTGSRKNSKELYIIDIYTLKYRQLTLGKGLTKSYNPKVSEDGQKIIYLKSTEQVQSLWCMNINGTDNVKIAIPQGVKDYDWSKDNINIACVYGGDEKPDTLCLINIENSNATTLLYSNKIYSIKKLKFSPEGRYIGFIGTSISTENIYVYDLECKKFINLTNSKTAVVISDFVWKIDASKIYYVCSDLGFESIYSLSLFSKAKHQIINAAAANIHLSYRPKIQ